MLGLPGDVVVVHAGSLAAATRDLGAVWVRAPDLDSVFVCVYGQLLAATGAGVRVVEVGRVEGGLGEVSVRVGVVSHRYLWGFCHANTWLAGFSSRGSATSTPSTSRVSASSRAASVRAARVVS